MTNVYYNLRDQNEMKKLVTKMIKKEKGLKCNLAKKASTHLNVLYQCINDLVFCFCYEKDPHVGIQ